MKSATAMWRQHADLLHSATTLYGTTVVTSGFGFAYWILAASLLPQDEVGYGSEVISAMTLVGTIAMAGLGTVLIWELPRRRTHRSGLIIAATMSCTVLGILLGAISLILGRSLNASLDEALRSLWSAAAFILGSGLTAASLTFDQAVIGLQRGGIQLRRNTEFTLIKLVLLAPGVLLLPHTQGASLAVSWTAGMSGSCALVAYRARISRRDIRNVDWSGLRQMANQAASHNWLNLATHLPFLVMPIVVATVVSPSANAAFYESWLIISFLYIVPSHLATALFALASGERSLVGAKLRLAVKISLLIGVPMSLFIVALARPVLSLLGHGYAELGTAPLQILAFGYIPTVIRVHYIAVCRATNNVGRAALVVSAGAVLEVASACLGGIYAGLVGLSIALVLAYGLEGIVTARRVFYAWSW